MKYITVSQWTLYGMRYTVWWRYCSLHVRTGVHVPFHWSAVIRISVCLKVFRKSRVSFSDADPVTSSPSPSLLSCSRHSLSSSVFLCILSRVKVGEWLLLILFLKLLTCDTWLLSRNIWSNWMSSCLLSSRFLSTVLGEDWNHQVKR